MLYCLLMLSKSMWIASLLSLALASPPKDVCVCLPGQACWPSSSDWSSFNDTVGGRLTVIHPVGQPCHDPTFDNATCSAIIETFTNSTWKADQIGTSSCDGSDCRWTPTSQLGNQQCSERDMLYRLQQDHSLWSRRRSCLWCRSRISRRYLQDDQVRLLQKLASHNQEYRT